LASFAQTTGAAYKPVARGLHWIVALVVIATIPVGVLMAYRLANPPPPMPASVPPFQKLVAELVHWALYALLFIMAVSGYVRVAAGGFPLEALDALGVPRLVPRSDALAETAKWIHGTARIPLAALIAAHVGAALFHAVVKRDGVFSRMWPGRG
jgi:cytochrome b561